MSQGNNGLSRGDRNRNARLAALRVVLPRDHAVLGIDLAQSRQAAVLADHDSRVIARWRPRCSPWKLGELLERALRKARSAGFSGITVACEPTGHRWMVIAQLAAERGIPMVCVQPLVVARAGEAEDYTRGKSDDRDAVLIARLAAQLHCYLPEQADRGWARLRHLGARRSRLIESATACGQQLRDLLEVARPAVLPAAADPLESATWLACLQVTLEGCDGDLAAVRALGRTPSSRRPAPRLELSARSGSVGGPPPPCTRRWQTPPGWPPSGPARSNAAGNHHRPARPAAHPAPANH
jgi:transposase